MKICTSCQLPKDDISFESGRRQCRICRNERRKSFGTRSGEGLTAYNLNYHYGLSLEQYKQMLQAQNGVCKICKGLDNGPWNRLAVDHCHTTGKVRGLLCAKCNKGLGQFCDNPQLLKQAAEYLI